MAITGADLKAARTAAKVGQRAIADLAGCSVPHISLIEKGDRPAPPKVLRAYKMALGIEVTETDPELDASTLEAMRRRALMTRVAQAAVGGLAIEPFLAFLDALPASAAPAHIGETEIVAVEQATDWLTEIDLRSGGGPAASLAQSALRYATGLRRATMTDDNRVRLHSAVGGLADRVGWSHYDARNHPAAQELFALALNEAAQSTDRDLWAHIMLNMSTQCFDQGDRTEAVATLRMALGDERISYVEQANLRIVCARHLGVIHDTQAAARQLRMAEDALAQADTGNAPVWARRVTAEPGHFASAMGLALFACDQDDAAQHQFTTALSHLGPGRIRTAIRCRARLSVIYMRNGAPAQGESQAREVMTMATGVRSARVQDDLVMIQTNAQRYGLNDLAAELAAA